MTSYNNQKKYCFISVSFLFSTEHHFWAAVVLSMTNELGPLTCALLLETLHGIPIHYPIEVRVRVTSIVPKIFDALRSVQFPVHDSTRHDTDELRVEAHFVRYR